MTPRARRRGAGAVAGLAAAGCLALVVAVAPGATGGEDDGGRSGGDRVLAARVVPASTTSLTAPTVPATPAAVAAVALRVPSIGVDSDLVGLGLQDDGTVEVPSDPDVAGWFELGPRPGGTGSTVLLGHVDSAAGPAVFARLAEVRRGAVVEVTLADGRLLDYEVRAVRTYANAAFPAQQVYGDHGRGQLALVTCGGEYDAARGGWQSNVVVYARPAPPG